MQVGYQISAVKFGTYFLLMSLMMLISETLGMLCAGLCRSELVGAIVLQGLYVPLLIFTGFFQARRPRPHPWPAACKTYAAHLWLLTCQLDLLCCCHQIYECESA